MSGEGGGVRNTVLGRFMWPSDGVEQPKS